MSFNEIDPMLMQQAPLIGQRRTPTKSEQRKMNVANIMLAQIQVSGTALSSLLEAGSAPHDYTNSNITEFAQNVSKSILKHSENSKGDFGGDIGLRKVRNQLAAQLIYSDLRGGNPHITGDENIAKYVGDFFNLATKLVEDAQEFAEQEVDREESSSSSIELPNS